MSTPDSAPHHDSIWESTSSHGEACCRSSFESQCDYECETNCLHNTNAQYRDKSSLSATNDINRRDVIFENNMTNSSDKVTYDKHNSFRSTRMRGTSSDRIIAKKRQDQKSVSSLGERTTDSGSSNTVSLFEKHLGKFYKLGKFEKSKRYSSNALYDESPNEAFYNKTGSARLSSQELFEKFCSEDFVSLYGHENDNGNYSYVKPRTNKYGQSKSLESSQTGIQNKSSKETNAKCDDYSKPISRSHASLGAIKKTKLNYSKKLDSLHACKRIDCSSEIPFRSPGSYNERRPHFTFDIPFSLPPNITNIIDYEHDGSMESLNEKDHSRSAPLLSPEKDGLQFNFDVAEVSKADNTSVLEESPSDATETRNLTLYEEPHSDRTSLSDIYEPCFSSGTRSKRSSIKRDLAYKSQPVFDLTNLDFRPIDDESPNTSKFVSVSSPDDIYQSNLDTKSNYSDSVFVSPERVSSKDDSKRTATTAKQRSVQDLNISERSGSSTLEEEPLSIMDKIPEIHVEKYEPVNFGFVSSLGIDCQLGRIERNLSPLIEQAIEAKSDSENLDSMIDLLDQSKLMSSRPSMHKLEPFYPKKITDDNKKQNESDDKYESVTEQYDKVVDLASLSSKREKSLLFKMKKVKDSSTANINRRTKCFPL